MLGCYARIAMLGLALWAAAGSPVCADDLADFNAAVEAASAHNRVALGYLRTGNGDLAALEIERLRAAWAKVTATKQPDVFKGNTLYVTTLTDVSVRLVAADLMLNSGRLDQARQSLEAMRAELSALRKSAGIVVLADCVRDANAAMDALMVYNTRGELDWSKPDMALGVSEKSTAYEKILDRCDTIASETVRKQPEFRRLIDGAKEGLTLIPQAVKTHNTALLHRVLIQLRSFDNLLAFRYG
jgi:hypothetical protein